MLVTYYEPGRGRFVSALVNSKFMKWNKKLGLFMPKKKYRKAMRIFMKRLIEASLLLEEEETEEDFPTMSSHLWMEEGDAEDSL
jgi:hypothetical protein